MSPRLLVVVVAAAAVTAGCSGLGAPWPGADATETLTPVSVPSESPTPEPPAASTTPTDRARPGDPALDPAGLVATHERALRDEAFRFTVTQRIVVNGSTIRNSTYTQTVTADHDAYTARFSRDSEGYAVNTTVSEVETYYNGSVLASRYRTKGGSQPRYAYLRNVSDRNLAAQSQLERLLGAFRGEYRGYTSGTSTTVIGATRLSDPTTLPHPLGTTEPRDGEILVEVFEDGLLRTVRVEYTVTVGQNRTGRVVRTIRFFDVDGTRIEAPDWIGVAAE